MNIQELIDYIYPNGEYNHNRANKNFIKSNFPEIYEIVKNDYKPNIYKLIHGIKETPKCANNNCNNEVSLKSIKDGFRKYCCNKCLNESLKHDEAFKTKISLAKTTNIYAERYNHIGAYKKNNYIHLPNYCKHGDLKFYDNNHYNEMFFRGDMLCEKCIEEFLLNDEFIDFEKNRIEFKKIYNDIKYNINEKWLKFNYPIIYKNIYQFTKHIECVSMSERIYIFINNLSERPKCISCDKPSHWIHSSLKYSTTCSDYNCSHTTSKGETELNTYIQSLGFDTHKGKVGKYNYDIICEKYIFEFNGLYWHSDSVIKDKKYHFNKKLEAKNNGYELVYIWEDDWNYKQEIVKSIINSKLNKTTRIYARNTVCKVITCEDANNFINDNHIQGKCVCKYAYGLFIHDELVSVMTFGNTRMVLNSNNKGIELLRFCSKLNTSIIGGASKLFSNFLKDNPNNIIISYANKDISNGNMYEKLGFTFIGETELSYCWAKDRKYHRSNFMKYKLVAEGYDASMTETEIMKSRGFNKIWLCGSKKYIYNKKETS